MSDGGIQAPALLDELENHLREDVEQQIRSGASMHQAFETAVRRIGQASELKMEFARVSEAPPGPGTLMGVVCVLFVGFILLLSGFTFFEMEMSVGEQIVAYAAVAFSLLVACGWRYAIPFLPVISNKRKRMVVGAVCILSGFLCASFFCNVILPPFERNHDGQIPAIGFWAVFPIAVSFCLGVGLMMSRREREFWRMRKVVGAPTRTAGT
jgi:hypothetical protein